MACRLTVSLAIEDGGPAVEATYEDVGEMDGASRAGLKALYSDARKRAPWPPASAPTCTPRSPRWSFRSAQVTVRFS